MEQIFLYYSKQQGNILRSLLYLFKSSLLLLLCLFANTAYSQENSYRSIFGGTSTEWNVMSGFCDAVATKTFTSRDTAVVNNKEYIKIIGNSKEWLLREDTRTGKVWWYDERSNSELLLMDMTLEPGDKFNLYEWDLTPVEAVVSEVYYKNNLKHIRFREQDPAVVVCAGIPFEFIEGTGQNAGFFYYQNSSHSLINSYVLCHFKDGERVYTGEKGGGACNINATSIEDDAKAVAVKVYPNPAADDVRVTFNNPRQEQAELLLFDILSRPVYSFKGRESEFQLSLRSKPSGVYFYRLRLNQNQIATGKIIRP